MAASVGTFAATYGETTDRSQEERALFAAGVDLRVTGFGRLQYASSEELERTLEAIPGVEGAASAYRGSLQLGPIPALSDRVDVLGVNPERGADLLWFRSDFASEDASTLFRHLQGSPAGGSGLVIQGEPTSVSVWVNPTQERSSSTLWLRTVDSAGRFRLHEFGLLDFGGYRRLETPIQAVREGIQFPLSIVGLLVTQPTNVSELARGSLLIDDLAVTVDGVETVIEDFEGAFRWEAVRTATRNRDVAQIVNQGTYRGFGAAQFAFRIGGAAAVRGLYVRDANVPLPAIVSERFMERTGLVAGGEFELVIGSVVVPATVQGTVKIFPTLDDSSTGFVIVNQEHLFYYAGMLNQQQPERSNEVWLRTDTRAHKDVVATLQDSYGIVPASLVDVEKTLEEVRSDPIVRAGGSGILLIALVAAFSILALGFVFTLYVGGQGRTVEVSVIRALGLSSRQILTMIGLEYLLIVAIGLVVGTIAGLRISSTMLTFLNVTEEGSRVLPPFALSTRWDTIGLAYIATAVAFVAGIAALALYFLRLPVSRILRLTR
jgi:hypothetical protein